MGDREAVAGEVEVDCGARGPTYLMGGGGGRIRNCDAVGIKSRAVKEPIF